MTGPKALFLLALLCSTGALAAGRSFAFQEDLMHTRWDIVLVAKDAEQARRLEKEVAGLIEHLDHALAMWKPDSELSAANAQASSAQGVTLSADLGQVVGLSLEACERSQGAFDMTVGPLTQAWYEARQKDEVLSEAQIKALMPLVGWKQASYEPATRRLHLAKAGMRLDLGGIAKGYAQDRAALLLRQNGIRHFLLNAGGQVYASGHKPGGSPWKVGIIHPRDKSRVCAILGLSDQVMATSGDYEQFTLIKGQRVHHLLDPRTGSYVKDGVVSATSVVSVKDRAWPATWADIHGKPVFVLGADKGLEYLRAEGAEGVVILEDEQGLKARTTDGLKGLDLQF